LDNQGNLYGVAELGGSGWGEVFELTRAASVAQLRDLYSFCSQPNCVDGVFPLGGLTYAGAAAGQPYDGESPLYGITIGDGSSHNANVFEILPAAGGWREQVIHDFCTNNRCSDFEYPDTSIVEDSSGNLYGTQWGDADTNGSMFEISPSGGNWTYAIPYIFCSQPACADGSSPSTTLAVEPSGSLYGGTLFGGDPCGCGVFFQMAPGGTQETVLHTYCTTDCSDGYAPSGSVFLDAAGNIYGTADYGGNFSYNSQGGGTAFEIENGQFVLLHQFCKKAACVDGSRPSGLTEGSSGRLFGVTSAGGRYNQGTIFEIEP
jgi:uncharacterized repeat protein (TIGR03803 family)